MTAANRHLTTALAIAALAALVLADAALAHDAPDEGDAAWIMADWMLWTFVLFTGWAFVAFVVAWKFGFFHNIEAAKYPMMEIEEPDYYTPDWARDDAAEGVGHG